MTEHEIDRVRAWLCCVFLPLSFVWAFATSLRRRLVRPASKSKIPVISVGNIHAGGSGKTPLVIALAEALTRFKPAVCSRGYGRASDASGWIDRTNYSTDRFGDEPCLIFARAQVPVWIGRKRADGVTAAYAQGSGVVILDDGFQHLTVDRTLDLITVDATRSPYDTFCHPLGDLRESVSSLRFASAVILAGGLPKQRQLWRQYLDQLFPILDVFELGDPMCETWANGHKIAVEHNEPLLAFCAIARPMRFARQVEKLGRLTHFVTAPDHHYWTGKDLAGLVQSAGSAGIKSMICTEKDWVKLCSLSLDKDFTWIHTKISYRLPKPLLDLVLQKISSPVSA